MIKIKNKRTRNILLSILNAALVAVVIIGFIWVSLLLSNTALNFTYLSTAAYRNNLWGGFLMTVGISLASLALSLIIGIITALFKISKVKFLRYFATVYVEFIRGTPLIMQIFLFYYIIGTAWGIDQKFVAGVLILSIFEGAYIAEILRGSILSLDSTQIEAAKAVGLTKSQTLKYVTLPQLTARTLPSLTGQFSSIVKDSSLLSLIALTELTQVTREISANTFLLFENYLLLGVLYLLLTLPISMLSKYFEKRYSYAN